MFALKGKGRKWDGVAPKGRDLAGRFVVPRLLRRPARFFSKIFAGDITVPRYAEAAGLVSIFAATAVYGSIAGGQFGALANGLTARLGFAVSQIEIAGQVNTSEVAVIEALGLDEFTSLATLDVREAREALQELPWVETAEVRKSYPDKLEIRIAERNAFAIWQVGDTLSLIERDGRVISTYTGFGFNNLPLVVGSGASTAAAPFMELLSGYPEIAGRIKALMLVGERRWNIRLANGITVKLPAEKPEEAVERLLAMDAQTEILSRDIASIDLRLSDRTTVALTENALARREAALEARDKAIKAAARRSNI